jgi:glyoxylase-like metal-dependent hydrolase (beta-lactamase superfamily II)
MDIISLGSGLSFFEIAPPGKNLRSGILGSYVIKDEKTAIVDTGPAVSLDLLLSGLSRLGLSLEEIDYILCTHIHLDHSGSLGQALKIMPKARCIVHEKGIPHLVDPSRLWESSLKTLENTARIYGPPDPVPRQKLIAAREGMFINLGELVLEILITPGHASHHICFLEKNHGRLFAGDAAGIRPGDTGVLQPATPPPFDLKLAFSSLDKLISRKPRDICYAHFGCYPDAISRLLEYKRLLLEWTKVIVGYLDQGFDGQKIYRAIQSQNNLPVIGVKTPVVPPDDLFFTMHDIQGLWEYLKKAGTGVLQELE